MEEKHLLTDSYIAKRDYDTFLDFLIEEFSITKSKAKKFYALKDLKRPLKAGQTVYVLKNISHDGEISKEFCGPRPEIITENDEFIALSKPSNLHIHPLTFNEGDNLLSFLKSIGKCDVLNVNTVHYDRGILYRLDYETSGVVIAAKQQSVYDEIRDNFNGLSKQKFYLAIVGGKLEGHKKLTDCLQTSFGGKKVRVKEDGVEATLELDALKYFSDQDITVVKVKLLTGHRHQIRVQLMNVGYPILGDELYGGRAANRLYLHAFHYSINYSQGTIAASDFNLKDFSDLLKISLPSLLDLGVRV